MDALTRVRFLVLIAGALGAAMPSAAQAGPVDDATVRVFAIGTVGTQEIDVRAGRLQLASPVAGHGSGFFVAGNLVMTAQHVVEGARHVVVRLPADRGVLPARVAFADKEADTAVLVVEPTAPQAPLALGAGPPAVRTNVFAVGYPLDPTRRLPQSARGIVAGFLDSGTIQLDIALNPGNSGGPVVDEQGTVIGMATARGNVEQGIQGIGYAVPLPLLSSAIAAAQRAGLGGGIPTATRDSAAVVDELIQHGALSELRKLEDAGARAFADDLDRTLRGLIERTADADLLVYVAAALWNAALVVDFGDPARRPPALTEARARDLSARLREGAMTAVRRAVARDGQVETRSTFVRVVLTSGPPGTAPGAVPFASAPAMRPRLATTLQLAPLVRYNPDGASQAAGFGGELRLAVRQGQSQTALTAALSAGQVMFSKESAHFTHRLLASDLGVSHLLGAVDLRAAIGLVLYRSAVEDGGTSDSASDLSLSARASVGYHVGVVELGIDLRLLSGPTVWLAPVYIAVTF